jgi:hypothetical protein
MPSSKRRFSILGILSLVGAMTLSGCATKSFVLEEIAPVEARVAELESTTEEHAERIDAVDRRAQDGISTANRPTPRLTMPARKPPLQTGRPSPPKKAPIRQ